MILVEEMETYGWEAAIRGMRNPLNSWAKSDSGFNMETDEFEVGENDKNLMFRLAHGGPVHGKFLRMIGVSMDITAPLFWWKEFDTYKVGTVRNSCSTMHKIMAKPFETSDFSMEHIEISNDVTSINYLRTIISYLNYLRNNYLYYKDIDKETAQSLWRLLIEALPSSYNQKATVTMNYEVLRNIYFSRKNHKLYEWNEFIKQIEQLPHFDLIKTPYSINTSND